MPGTCVLERVHGGDGRSAGCQHRVEDEEVPDLLGARNLEVVVAGLEGLLVPGKSDMTYPRGRDHLRDALHHAQSGPEDGYQHDLPTIDPGADHPLERGLDLGGFGGQVAGDLVGHEGGNFPHQLLEIPAGRPPVTQQGQLVLNQGMADDGQVGMSGGHGHRIWVGGLGYGKGGRGVGGGGKSNHKGAGVRRVRGWAPRLYALVARARGRRPPGGMHTTRRGGRQERRPAPRRLQSTTARGIPPGGVWG